MLRFLLASLILVSTPAMAKDDGGFGSARFSNQPPTALGQIVTNQLAVSDKKDAVPQSPADIEPAAGTGNENLEPTDIEHSNHQTEPYTIQKDIEVR